MDSVSRQLYELQKEKFRKFASKVKSMRSYQKTYLKFRSSSDLKNSKRLENEVDNMIMDFEKQDPAAPIPEQSNLF